MGDTRKRLLDMSEKIERLTAALEHLGKMLKETSDEEDRLRGLLKTAKCPDPDCDGNGTVCAGAYNHGNGDIEYDLHQCQWCDERDHALQHKDPDNLKVTQNRSLAKGRDVSSADRVPVKRETAESARVATSRGRGAHPSQHKDPDDKESK